MLGSASPGLILITSGVGGSADPPVLTSTGANCTGMSLITVLPLSLACQARDCFWCRASLAHGQLVGFGTTKSACKARAEKRPVSKGKDGLPSNDKGSSSPEIAGRCACSPCFSANLQGVTPCLMLAQYPIAACDCCQAALQHFHFLAAHCFYIGCQFSEQDMQVI